MDYEKEVTKNLNLVSQNPESEKMRKQAKEGMYSLLETAFEAGKTEGYSQGHAQGLLSGAEKILPAVGTAYQKGLEGFQAEQKP